ncbi:MAG: hypothetical protein ACXWQE_07435 [Bdellovibrionales bacterium]
MSPLCYGQGHLQDDDAWALCERVLTSHLSQWKRQARSNLAKIAPYPIYPVQVENAPALVAAALNIKPGELNELPRHSLRLSVDGDRLQLEIENWPRFQRALISLRKPEVIKDFTLAQATVDTEHDSFFALSVQANTRLFYLIREFSHETQLGLIFPLREINDQGPGHVPFFEFQLGLLKPCFYPPTYEEQHFTGENGESLCVDTLVNLSTWPENI